MKVSLEERREFKYVLPRSSRAAFEVWLRRSTALFSAVYNPRLVYNVYADTIAWDSFTSNLDGISERGKLRLRWYGEQSFVNVLRLERKLKRENSTIKQSIEIPGIDLDDLSWPRLNAHLVHHSPPAWSMEVALLRFPVSRNHYSRRYYLSRDRSIRLTVDSDLVIHDLINTSCMMEGTRRCVAFDIVEVKLPVTALPRAAKIFADFPARLSRMSKYIFGVQASFS